MGGRCTVSKYRSLVKKRKKESTAVKLKASYYVGLPNKQGKNKTLENLSTANALQLEAARRRTVPIRFNSSPVPSLKSF